MQVYSILGGLPGLLKLFDPEMSIRENICTHILSPHSLLCMEGERIVAQELRETAVYHTILSALAQGKQKLNDLYHYTGFSRAKISVYLKNLIQMEIVEKVFSYDTEGRENTMKGVYSIKDHYVAFWFTFLFPYQSKLMRIGAQEFYEHFISEKLQAYCEHSFGGVCRELIRETGKCESFPVEPKHVGNWIGKAGNMEIVVQDDEGITAVGICNWTKEVFPMEDFEWLQFCAKQAKLEVSFYYLFTRKRFEKKLSEEAEKNQKIKLIPFETCTQYFDAR